MISGQLHDADFKHQEKFQVNFKLEITTMLTVEKVYSNHCMYEAIIMGF